MFLLRRNLPVTWGGWYDSFNYPNQPTRTVSQGPKGVPWIHTGNGGSAIEGGRLRVGIDTVTTNPGGPVFEFESFTPHWGVDFDLYWNPAEGANYGHQVIIQQSWKEIGNAFTDAVLMTIAAGIKPSASYIEVAESGNYIDLGTRTSLLSLTLPQNVRDMPQPLNVRIWVDHDLVMRFWLNGMYVGACAVTTARKFRPSRRGIKFYNSSTVESYVEWIHVYDRPQQLMALGNGPWTTTTFTDTFNRANGAVGNGWTVLGAAGQISSNSYATTGNGDGRRAIIRQVTGYDGSALAGGMRVVATVGGAIGPGTVAMSGIVLRCNAAGTQGLVLQCRANKIQMGYFTNALDANSGTYTFVNDQNVTINNGDVLSFACFRDYAWAENLTKGNVISYMTIPSGAPPVTNSYAGVRVERAPFSNSHSWNEVALQRP